jgi:hypothetical protein
MDGCSINEAFPSGGFGSVDCIGQGTAEISRRQEKKKARKCRGPHSAYLNSGMNMVGSVDPDRQTVKPMAEVPAMNMKTGLYEHTPVTQQYNFETFVGDSPDLSEIQAGVKGPNSLQSGGSSASFFGANPNDESTNPVAPKRGLVENFSSSVAPYVNIIGQDPNYSLEPDFGKTFTGKGADRASGAGLRTENSVSQQNNYLTPSEMLPSSILPFPNTDTFWKNNPTGGQSAFFANLRPPGGQPTGQVPKEEDPASKREMMEKLDRIFARLDDMEHVKAENSQTEILLFIMTGLGVIFLMDIGCRAAANLSRR